jgi:hypothetical protein
MMGFATLNPSYEQLQSLCSMMMLPLTTVPVEQISNMFNLLSIAN